MDFGLIVDVETTGLNPNKDRIIEMGFVEFAMGSSGIPTISTMYSGLEDPQAPLSVEVARITGLSDEALKDQKIDWNLVKRHWSRASLIVAHNAEFDRSFLMARPELSDSRQHWACSMRHIDWQDKNFGSLKLQYLAADHGFVNPFAHRALFDCATTFRLIASHMTELVENSYAPQYDLIAMGSPFDSKDLLKARGYRWDAEVRAWRKLVTVSKLEAEREFLSREVYKGQSRHVEEEVLFNPRT